LNNKPVSKAVKFGAIAGGVLLLVILIALIVPALGSSGNGNYVKYENYITSHYQPDSEETFLMYNGKLLRDTAEGRLFYETGDRSGNTDLYISDDSTLYAVIKTSLVKIAEDVETAKLSLDGTTALYLDEDDVLYSVQLKKNHSEKVAEDIEWYMISPDGKIFFYREIDDSTVIMLKSGKETKLPKGLQPFSVSVKGDLIYGIKNGEDLIAYNVKKEDSYKLAGTYSRYWLNADRTEILYTVDGKLYLCINGGEKIKIGNYNYISAITTAYTAAVKSYVGTMLVYKDADAEEYSIGYINKKHEMVQLVKKAGKSSGVYILDDGDAFIYGRNGNLYKAEKRNKYEPEKIASDIMRCAVTQSGLVYYTDDENVLYSVKNSKKTEIMEDVDGALTVSPDGILYFLADYDECGDLYMCKDGKKAQKIASDVAAVSVMPNYSYYVTEMEKVDDINVSDLYVSFNGKKFEKILEEVTRG